MQVGFRQIRVWCSELADRPAVCPGFGFRVQGYRGTSLIRNAHRVQGYLAHENPEGTGVRRSSETPPSYKPTVGLCLGSYDGPKREGEGLFLMSEVTLHICASKLELLIK